MKIEIKSCFQGAKEAEGTGVIIDVLRASSTTNEILNKKAKCVIPVKTIEEAFDLKRKNHEYLLFGDDKGRVPFGFDFGNSPTQAQFLN